MIYRYSYIVFSSALIFSVLFFSWLPHPSFRELPFFPNWLVKWTDEYENLRTAIPFVPLSIFLKTATGKSYFFCFCICLVLIIIAEVGQLLLPLRSFDIGDICYAIIGSVIGFGILVVLCFLKFSIKR